jgi:hypothetical protein
MEVPTKINDTQHFARSESAEQRPEAAAAASQGAPPSNTAPANCTSPRVRVLLTGIDSLYVSYKGTLKENWDRRLAACKESARSEEPEERLQAQVEIGGHRFVVHDRRSGRFAYVVSDNWFRIAVARAAATSMPVAYHSRPN